MSPKTRRIIGWVLTGLLAAFMGMSIFGKFQESPEVLESLSGTKMTMETMRNIGIVEAICVILWVIPRTGIAGTLLLCSYLGGAICFHVVKGMEIWAPAGICAAVWIISAIRFPELTRRLFGGQSGL